MEKAEKQFEREVGFPVDISIDLNNYEINFIVKMPVQKIISKIKIKKYE